MGFENALSKRQSRRVVGNTSCLDHCIRMTLATGKRIPSGRLEGIGTGVANGRRTAVPSENL